MRLSRPWYIEGQRKRVVYGATSRTLTAGDSGTHFVSGEADAVFALPKSSNKIKGVEFTIECGTLSTTTGLAFSPHADDAIGGNGLTVTVDKDLINTAATDRLGDMVTIYCTGETGAAAWRIKSIIGTWAKQG